MNKSPHSSGDSNPPTPLSHAAVLAARDPQWAHAYRDDDFLPPIEVEIEEELLPPEDAPPEFKELRRQQQLALEQLLEGKSVAWAAASAQVDRRTVHRWVRDDERFKAAMEACRGRTVEAVRRQLLAAAPKAAAAIAEAADKGDIKAAMALLKALGLFGSPPAAESSNPPGPPWPTRGRTPRVLTEPAALTGTQSATAPEPSNAPAPPVVEEKFDWRKVKRVPQRNGGYRLVYKGEAYMEAMRIANENTIRMGEKAG